MAVDVSDELVDALRRMITPLGSEVYTDVANAVLVGYLSDAFWNGKLDGFFGSYTETDGVITPESGDTDLGRDWQSLIVFYAAFAIIEAGLRSQSTLFRAKAGPVEYETQNSAQLLRDHLRLLADRRDYLLETLSSSYTISPGYIDNVIARTNSVFYGDGYFESGQMSNW